MSLSTSMVFLHYLDSFVGYIVIHLITYSSKHEVIVKNTEVLLILPVWCFPVISFPSVQLISVPNIQMFLSFYVAIFLSSFSLLQFILNVTFTIIFQKYSSFPIIFSFRRPCIDSCCLKFQIPKKLHKSIQ